jgi:hypothetical protein
MPFEIRSWVRPFSGNVTTQILLVLADVNNLPPLAVFITTVVNIKATRTGSTPKRVQAFNRNTRPLGILPFEAGLADRLNLEHSNHHKRSDENELSLCVRVPGERKINQTSHGCFPSCALLEPAHKVTMLPRRHERPFWSLNCKRRNRFKNARSFIAHAHP